MEEKKFDANTAIGFFLIFVIFMWMMYNSSQKQAEKIKEEEQKQEVVETNNVDNKKPTLTKETEPVVENDSTTNTETSIKYGVFAQSDNQKSSETVTKLDNQLMSIEIANKGGFLVNQTLKDFDRFRKNSGQKVALIKDDNASFNIQFKGTDGSIYDTKDLIFTPQLSKVGDNKVLSMKLKINEQQFLEYIYTLKPNDYMLDFQIRSQGLEQVLGNTEALDLTWDMSVYRNEKSVSYENRYTEIWVEYEKGKTDYVGQAKLKETQEKEVTFIAYKQQFFSSILLTKTPFKTVDLISQNLVDDESKDTIFTKQFTSKIPLAVNNGNVNHKMQWYYGPTDYKILKSYNKNIEKAVWFGWGIFGWINKFIFYPVFGMLTKFVPYGIAIILLTVFVRIILSPLTYKSYLSQAKMKVIRPEIQELSQKIKDPMKRQQETMKLYGKAGVNPMAGCLPAFLQIPVFYALFSFFPVAISLRQKSFLWSDDLSSYDTIFNLPFYIPFYGNHVSLFPILASIAIFFYMKMTTGDQQMAAPTQEGMPDMSKIMKVMIYISPLMMMIFFNNYSSGLSLYYFVSNLLTIGIMYVIKNHVIDQEKIHAQIQENKTKPRKMNKFQRKMQEMMEQAEAAKNQKK